MRRNLKVDRVLRLSPAQPPSVGTVAEDTEQKEGGEGDGDEDPEARRPTDGYVARAEGVCCHPRRKGWWVFIAVAA